MVLHHFSNAGADVVDVFAVEGSNAHAAGICTVNAELVAQAHHLVFAQAAVAEHADLGGDEAHVLFHASGFEFFNKRASHGFDAHAHFCQFVFPLLAQFRVAQNSRHHAATVCRWVAVVGADGDFELAQHAVGLCLVGA